MPAWSTACETSNPLERCGRAGQLQSFGRCRGNVTIILRLNDEVDVAVPIKPENKSKYPADREQMTDPSDYTLGTFSNCTSAADAKRPSIADMEAAVAKLNEIRFVNRGPNIDTIYRANWLTDTMIMIDGHCFIPPRALEQLLNTATAVDHIRGAMVRVETDHDAAWKVWTTLTILWCQACSRYPLSLGAAGACANPNCKAVP